MHSDVNNVLVHLLALHLHSALNFKQLAQKGAFKGSQTDCLMHAFDKAKNTLKSLVADLPLFVSPVSRAGPFHLGPVLCQLNGTNGYVT